MLVALMAWATQKPAESKRDSDIDKELGNLKKEVANLKDAIREKKG